MRLVHHNGFEIILRKLLQPLFLTEGLHGANSHGHPTAQRGGACLFIGTVQPGHLFHLVRRLIQQLATMGHDEGASAIVYLFLDHGGKAHRLAAPGGENQKRALPTLRPLVQNGVPCLGLIGPELNCHA